MKVLSALLCDAASVREGLLFVLGGGVTRLRRSEFPSPLRLQLALMLELHPMELERPHELDVRVQGQDGDELARIRGGFQYGSADLAAGETALLPFVVDLAPVELPSAGVYGVDVAIDGTHHHGLTFRARPVGKAADAQG